MAYKLDTIPQKSYETVALVRPKPGMCSFGSYSRVIMPHYIYKGGHFRHLYFRAMFKQAYLRPTLKLNKKYVLDV